MRLYAYIYYLSHIHTACCMRYAHINIVTPHFRSERLQNISFLPHATSSSVDRDLLNICRERIHMFSFRENAGEDTT